MSQGQIRCCGSSLFLKRAYGVGYSFTVVLQPGTDVEKIQDDLDNIVLNTVKGATTVATGIYMFIFLDFYFFYIFMDLLISDVICVFPKYHT